MMPTRFAITVLLLTAGLAHGETYIYQETDGTRWITDRKLDPGQFRFIDRYGRPTASKSCTGMTDVLLENRAKLYMPTVRQYALEKALDPFLIKAIITVESCFDRRAVSRAGAHGLMQLMPSVAQEYNVLNRFDANENLRGGITHFSDLMRKYSNNMKLALAAYNAGVHNVKKYNGVPPFRETQHYVEKVLKYFELYKKQTDQTALQ